MPPTLSNTQEQVLEQTQRLTARQVAYMRLLEMPLESLRSRIENELIENPALEAKKSEEAEGAESTDLADAAENDELQAAAAAPDEEAIDRGKLDEIDYFESERAPRAQYDPDSDYSFDDPATPDFHDTLLAQMGEYNLSERQRELLEYLIGSLDDDGLLKKKLYVIADELEIYRQLTVSVHELEETLHTLQQFDPAGIGAQSLQETLQLQAERRVRQHPENHLWGLLLRVVSEQWQALTGNRWDIIRHRLKITESEARALQRMLRTLTPSPGCPPGERVGAQGNGNAIIADFIVETQEDGCLTVTLNEPGIPTLRISEDYEALIPKQRNRDEQNYMRQRIGRATIFIQNVQSRRETLLRVMREVAAAQRDYITSGDESELHPLAMKDVAEATGTDLSIVSRVAGSKWVETAHGLRPLRWFFRGQGGVVRDDGTALEQDRIKEALRQVIEAEDKQKPMADEALTRVLQDKGYPVARRTVAKYREMMGIPVARLRRMR